MNRKMCSQKIFRDEVVYRSLVDCPIGNVSTCGHLATSYGLSAFRTLPHFALVYILAGEGFYQSRDHPEQKLRSGNALILPPGISHRYGPTGEEGWSEVYLLFNGSVFQQWLRTGILNPKASILQAQPIDEWARRITSVLPPSENLYTSSRTSLKAVCRLQNLLAQLLDEAPENLLDVDAEWLAQARALLEEIPFRGQATVSRQLRTTTDCFRKRFHKLLGISPREYRHSYLVDRASALLQNGKLRDHEIANTLGFYDAAHFSKFFKSRSGQTPSSFRQSQPEIRHGSKAFDESTQITYFNDKPKEKPQ